MQIMVAAAASTSDIAMVVHLQCALVLPLSNASLHITDCQSGEDAVSSRAP